MISPTKRDVGRTVIYQQDWQVQRGLPGESGVITSLNLQYVFVRYGSDQHSKATRREDLYWAHDGESG